MYSARRSPHRRQPSGVPLRDRGHPLTNGIVTCLPLNGQPQEQVAYGTTTLGSAGSFATGLRGRNLRGAGVTAAGSVPLNLGTTAALTISCWVSWDAFANDDKMLCEYTATANSNNGFFLLPNESSAGGWCFQFTVGGVGGDNAYYFTRPSAAAWHHFVVQFDGSASTKVKAAWVDGVAQTITTIVERTLTGTFVVTDTLHLFSRNEASLFGVGNLQDFCIWNRLLTSHEVLSLFERTWAIYLGPRRMVGHPTVPLPVMTTQISPMVAQ